MMDANENDNIKSNKKNIPISSLKNNKFKNWTAEQIIKKYEDVLFSREKQFYELSNEIGKLTQKIQFLVQKKEKSKYNNNILNDIFSKKQQLLKQELSNKEIVFMKLTDLEHKYDDLQNKIDDIINKQNALADSTQREREKMIQDKEEGKKLIDKELNNETKEEKEEKEEKAEEEKENEIKNSENEIIKENNMNNIKEQNIEKIEEMKNENNINENINLLIMEDKKEIEKEDNKKPDNN